MSDKAVKTRFNVTLPKEYVKKLDQLVEKGVYLDRQSIIRDALRIVFRLYKMKPFVKPFEDEDL